MKTLFNQAFVVCVLMVASACSGSKQLSSVTQEHATGNVELVYAGSQVAENLVKEIIYAPNGDTLSVTPMKKGAVHGSLVRYYSGNIIKEVLSFQNGSQTGLYQRFDDQGVLVFEGKLEQGLKQGVWTTWYDEVQMEEQRSYSDD
ncbi:MAG: toxin-antitoxin system YwqK family antitoxin, partial [Flavobacteriales bacterium]